MKPFSRTILRNERGVATIEFALWVVFILVALLPSLDFAAYLIQKQRLGSAVGEAAILAYNMRNDTVNTTQLTNYVTARSGISANTFVASVSCIGGKQNCSVAPASRACTCTSGSNPVVYTVTSTCGSTCSNGTTSGYYLTVGGSYPYQSLLKNPLLDGKALKASTTVRLQ